MNLKYKGIPFIQSLIHKMRNFSIILEQFNYWRSGLLWFVIFTNLAVSILVAYKIYSFQADLPKELPIILSQQTSESKFISTPYILIALSVNIAIQIISIAIGGKLYFRLKHVSFFILVCSTVASALFFLSINKSINMALP